MPAEGSGLRLACGTGHEVSQVIIEYGIGDGAFNGEWHRHARSIR
jgi:hypothetical protein